MKHTVLLADGRVACPKCGAVNSFTSKRTGKAKLLAAPLLITVVAMPKRLRCNGCGANLKRGGGAAAKVRAPHSISITTRSTRKNRPQP